MAGVLTEDVLWLLGGIQLHTTPGLLMVNLVHRTWMEYGLKVYWKLYLCFYLHEH